MKKSPAIRRRKPIGDEIEITRRLKNFNKLFKTLPFEKAVRGACGGSVWKQHQQLLL